MMDNLKLTFPSPHPGKHLLVETRVDAFSSWLEELPSGNMPRFVSEVADAVSNINRTDLPISQRMRLIQHADKAYEKIHDFYRPLMKSGPHKGKHAPLNELNELYRLTIEMSFAYKMAVYAFIDKKTLFGKNQKLSNTINMSLHYLGLVLLEHYELYTPIPMHIWREIHQLYYTAEKRELSEIKNINLGLKNTFNDSETTYLRICLIALSNPYHLKRGDHWEVFIYLSHWTKTTIISEDPTDFSNKNCFIINLDGDDKPFAEKEFFEHDNPNIRFLLTKPLTRKLNNKINEIAQTNRAPKECFSNNVIGRKANELLKDMLDSWESKQERKAPRYPKINKMEVIWGLNDIHAVVSRDDPLQVQNTNATDCENLIQSHWITVNSSEGGICISQPREKVSDIDVGLIVALRNTIDDGSNSNWSLGVICWITGNERNGTQVGIQYIKGHIQAVALQARQGSELLNREQVALLLSGERIEGLSTPTLLTKNGIYIEGRQLVLSIGEETQYIFARMKIDSPSAIDRFFYQADLGAVALKNSEQNVPKEHSSSDEEVINLSAMPLAYVEDFETDESIAETASEELPVTLDDIIVSKNK